MNFSFFVAHVLEEEEKQAVLLVLYILTGILGIPAWVKLSALYGKKPVYIAALSMQCLALVLISGFVEEGSIAAYAGAVTLAGLATGGTGTIALSCLSDVCDSEELRAGGHRNEAKALGLYDITRKLGSAGGVGISYSLIDASGFSAGAEKQTEETRSAIRLWYSTFPASMILIGIFVFSAFYDIDRAKQMSTLDALRALRIQRTSTAGDNSEKRPCAGEAKSAIGSKEMEKGRGFCK
jgi:GPH family glycoside/pentoside/hexuronide:cation symporter